jgi:hypothetical protein
MEKLTSSTKKLNITKPSLKSFSMVTLDGYMVKKYCQKFADFVEVDFHVAGVLLKHVYKVELSLDGLIMIWRRAILVYFFESKWMASMLGRIFNPNESRMTTACNKSGMGGRRTTGCILHLKRMP